MSKHASTQASKRIIVGVNEENLVLRRRRVISHFDDTKLVPVPVVVIDLGNDKARYGTPYSVQITVSWIGKLGMYKVPL